MKPRLVSLQCCGESIEKALAIYYTTMQRNEKFYSDYDVVMFYGHNLPKKDATLNVHGTVGFYAQFLSDLSFLPSCSKEYFINNADSILETLCLRGKITERNWNKLSSNKFLYWEFVRNVPFEYIYPDYYRKVISNSCNLFSIKAIKPLYLERIWPQILFDINEDLFRYSIYALEGNGIIGKYTVNGDNKVDLVRNLSRRCCLSGNSAILLRTIGYRIGIMTTIGYRMHRRSVRPNRNYELNRLFERHSFIVEPTNPILSNHFNSVGFPCIEEEKNNYVFAQVFREYLSLFHNDLHL